MQTLFSENRCLYADRFVAKEEGATRTYAKLKDEYLSLKAILQIAGVNLTDIDRIKE